AADPKQREAQPSSWEAELVAKAIKTLTDAASSPYEVERACGVLETFAAHPGVGGIKLRLAHSLGIREINPDGPKYLVDVLLARRLISLFAGLPKSGKTTLTGTLVTALLRCEPFLGLATHLAEDEDILWLSEEPPEVVHSRLIDDLGLDPDLVRQR